MPKDSKKVKVKKEESERALSVQHSTTEETLAAFQPLHAVHFLQLNTIWEADLRIPSAASRKAWAVARNLNPNNVNAWWYRRRAVAKKLRIKIPQDSYELDVGVPPEIPPPESKEENDADNLDFSSDSAIPQACSLPIDLADSANTDSPSSHTSGPALLIEENPLFGVLASEMSAYMRSSSPVCPSLIRGQSSRSSSPLPPSSPPPETLLRSPSPAARDLFLPQDFIHDNLESNELDQPIDRVCRSAGIRRFV